MLQPRSPIVTILGHVDHGKTTLLDYIRKSQITNKEHGGITQKIGAYEIITDFKGYKNNRITFIDTPGHEAFSQLRARGANVSDIALLLIDGKDSLMPQTIESISHIKSANIPYIVVINKIDLADAKPEKIKNDLLKYEVLVEDKGGNVPVALVSAKTGKGIKELLEIILLISESLRLEYDQQSPCLAYIIEAKKDRRGVIASAIIKNGHIKVGDTLYHQDKSFKVRSLINDLGQPISKAFPSTPFELLGFSQMPQVGETITHQAISPTINEDNQNQVINQVIDYNQLMGKVEAVKKLSVIIKTDSQGSLEAINQSLCKNDDINIELKAIGEINRSDVFLAKATKAIIVGFGVKANNESEDLAKQEKVIIKTYNIIYELLDELTEVTNLIKEKEEKEKNLKGEAKVLANFIIEKETIFGVKIIKGKINLNDQLEVYRNNKLIGKTKLVSLKNRAKNVVEAKKNEEAGMMFYPLLDITIGDVVKSIL